MEDGCWEERVGTSVGCVRNGKAAADPSRPDPCTNEHERYLDWMISGLGTVIRVRDQDG